MWGQSLISRQRAEPALSSRDAESCRAPTPLNLPSTFTRLREGLRPIVTVSMKRKECGGLTPPSLQMSKLSTTAGSALAFETFLGVDLPSLEDLFLCQEAAHLALN
jgi:hypothetical protein